MRVALLAADPLWQCLCPAWTTRALAKPTKLLRQPQATIQRLRSPHLHSRRSYAQTQWEDREPNLRRLDAASKHQSVVYNPINNTPVRQYDEGLLITPPRRVKEREWRDKSDSVDLSEESTVSLYNRLRTAAFNGRFEHTRRVAEHLVKERREPPSVQLYNALILVNINYEYGAAWRVHELLEELRSEGLQADAGICHAVLKVLSVHVDHLLRSDVLAYMRMKWFQLSEDGVHDVAAGLLREGLFEQALERLDIMRRDGTRVQGWLLDMYVYMLCEAGELDEAHRILRARFDGGELVISKTLWHTFLDSASAAHHHLGTKFVWNAQVNRDYLHPSSGICLNALVTAARAGDAVLATDVFTHLSAKPSGGTTFQPIHYQLLIESYLNASPPDLKRAISILTLMPMEKIQPSVSETRSLYLYLRDKPALTAHAFDNLREFHSQNRKIPIAALNLVIECYVQQRNLSEALKVYKLIHTFVPIAEGAKKSFANVETFNLLLRGCRVADTPDAARASFLVGELLALKVKPTALTYDRLILVFIEAGSRALKDAAGDAAHVEEGQQLLDWAYRHFSDMQTLGWMPRFGTLEKLSTELAKIGDERCWDVLQLAEDSKEKVEGWDEKGKWARKNAEDAWEERRTGGLGSNTGLTDSYSTAGQAVVA